MNKNSGGGWLLLLAIIIGAVGWIFWPTISREYNRLTHPSIVLPALPTVTVPQFGATATPVLDAEATAQAQRGQPIPTQELAFIRDGDLPGLQHLFDVNAHFWDSISQNVATRDIAGVAEWPAKVTTTWLGAEVGSHVITYTSVWKGDAIGGLTAAFGVPSVSLDENGWTEVQRTQSITQTNLTLVESWTTATVTYTGQTCVASVEHWDPSPIHYGEITIDSTVHHDPTAYEWEFMLDPVNHNSYAIWTGDLITGIGADIRNEDHRSAMDMAEKTSKVIALQDDKMVKLIEQVEASVNPGGYFYNHQILPIYTPELANQYRVLAFVIDINLTRLTGPDGRILRCDGTPVIQ